MTGTGNRPQERDQHGLLGEQDEHGKLDKVIADQAVTDWLKAWPSESLTDEQWQTLGDRVQTSLRSLRSPLSAVAQENAAKWLAPPFDDARNLRLSTTGFAVDGSSAQSSRFPRSSQRPSLKEFARRVSLSQPPGKDVTGQGDPAAGAPSAHTVTSDSGAFDLHAMLAGDIAEQTCAHDSARVSSEASVENSANTADKPLAASQRVSVVSSAISADGGDTASTHEASAPTRGDSFPPAEIGAKNQTATDVGREVLPLASRRRRVPMPVVFGGIVGALALAAAVFLLVQRKGDVLSFGSLEQDQGAPAVAMVQEEGMEQAAPPAVTATSNRDQPEALTRNPEEFATPDDKAEPQRRSLGGGLGGHAKGPAAIGAGHPPATSNSEDSAESRDPIASREESSLPEPAAAQAAAPTSPQSLSEAMGRAVGASNSGEPAEKAAPRNDGSLPETPSQGAIQSALASVRDAARACVVYLDHPSRATITFASNGTVSSVTVSGAASGKSAEVCIKNALKKARVGPFKKPYFNVTMTVRPDP